MLQAYPYLGYIKEMIACGVNRPALINYTKISDILSFYLNKILKSEISAAEGLQEADETIKSDKLFLR